MTLDRGGRTPETLTSLLRAELSAVKTYRGALARFGGPAADARLRKICVDHSRAVQVLHGLLLRHGDDAPTSTAASGLSTAAGPIDDALAEMVRSLRADEARQVEAYRRALADPALAVDIKALIRSDLLRRSETHVPVLEALIDG